MRAAHEPNGLRLFAKLGCMHGGKHDGSAATVMPPVSGHQFKHHDNICFAGLLLPPPQIALLPAVLGGPGGSLAHLPMAWLPIDSNVVTLNGSGAVFSLPLLGTSIEASGPVRCLLMC